MKKTTERIAAVAVAVLLGSLLAAVAIISCERIVSPGEARIGTIEIKKRQT